MDKLQGTNIFVGERDLKDDGNTLASEKAKAWVRARPIGYISFWHRLKCTWLVFQGKADILIWKYQ